MVGKKWIRMTHDFRSVSDISLHFHELSLRLESRTNHISDPACLGTAASILLDFTVILTPIITVSEVNHKLRQTISLLPVWPARLTVVLDF